MLAACWFGSLEVWGGTGGCRPPQCRNTATEILHSNFRADETAYNGENGNVTVIAFLNKKGNENEGAAVFEEHQFLIARAWQERSLHLLRWVLDDNICKFKMSDIKKQQQRKTTKTIRQTEQPQIFLFLWHALHNKIISAQFLLFTEQGDCEFQGLKTWMVSREHPAILCVLPASLICWCSSAQPATNISSVELHLQPRMISLNALVIFSCFSFQVTLPSVHT